MIYALFGWSSLNVAEHSRTDPTPSTPGNVLSVRNVPDHTQVIKLIAEHERTDPTIAADDGGSAILHAAKARHPEALAWLLQSSGVGTAGLSESQTCSDSVAEHIKSTL